MSITFNKVCNEIGKACCQAATYVKKETEECLDRFSTMPSSKQMETLLKTAVIALIVGLIVGPVCAAIAAVVSFYYFTRYYDVADAASDYLQNFGSKLTSFANKTASEFNQFCRAAEGLF
jgi:hypothetical protein